MATRRISVPPTISWSPRSSIDSSLHPQVDSVLKNLKSCTRRLQTAMDSQQLELQILERLYYKGNNQHRTALFWRRVAEVRRFGSRFQEMALNELVERLRAAFWGDASQQSSKSMKGSWTHVPDASAVALTLKRLTASFTLMDKMRECLTKAYHHLNLNLQTGAFLQLILTLTAIISRLDVLTTELRPAVEQCCTTIHRLLQILDPARASTFKLLGQQLKKEAAVPRPVSSSATPAGLVEEFGDEDTGSTVLRPTGPESNSIAGKDAVEDVFNEAMQPQLVDSFHFSSETIVSAAPSVVRETVFRRAGESPVPAATKPVKRKTTESKKDSKDKETRKAKKKKRDEIDDIFGF